MAHSSSPVRVLFDENVSRHLKSALPESISALPRTIVAQFLGIVVLAVGTLHVPELRPYMPAVAEALRRVRSGERILIAL